MARWYGIPKGEWFSTGRCVRGEYSNRLDSAGRLRLWDEHPYFGGKIHKYYSAEKMEAGWCALRNDASGDIIGLSYPVERVPYLGVWEGIFGKDYITALEPCTGAKDGLDVAKLWNKAGVIEAESEYSWYLNLTFDATRDFHFIDAGGFLH